MSPLREILTAYSTVITAGATSARPWHEVSLPADLYESLAPELSEPEAHYGFAISAPSSNRLRVQPAGYDTQIQIVWSRVLGAESQALDCLAALDDEQALLLVIDQLGITRNAIVKSISRKVTAGQSCGLFVGRLTLTLPHYYPLI